jgi:7-cyano-7-deazaguanine synthase
MKKAIVLFSGGLDSTTCLAIAKSEGYECYALSFNYGQKHNAELNAAKKIAEQYQIKKHIIIDLNIHQWGGSALTDETIDVPNYSGDGKIPITYVPARNSIFLAIAFSWAEVVAADHIFIGANAIDYSGYPDCRPEFLNAMEHALNLGTKRGVEGEHGKIHVPLLSMSKAEIIKKGVALGVDYANTVSCYRADALGRACGTCDCCVLRRKGFVDADVEDQTRYW